MKKIQTLNEEIQKMRKLMSFNINENSHDSLSEENFKKSTEGTYLINEQSYKGNWVIIWLESKGKGNDLQIKANDNSGFADKIIGTISNDVLTLNNDGNFIFEKRSYPKTIEQIDVLVDKGLISVKEDIDNKNIVKTDSPILSKKQIRRAEKDFLNKMNKSIDAADWKGGNSGTILIDHVLFPNAKNVGIGNGYLWYGINEKFNSELATVDDTPPDDPKPGTEITVEVFNVNDIGNTYLNNMVKPNLVGKNLADFNRLAEQFSNYIKAGGLEKLTNVTMQGSADASIPSWSGPNGETIDHNYGGIKFQKNPKPKVLEEMNLYLAEFRAINYSNLLIDKIKELCGETIKIIQLPPISYLNQPEKKGKEYRSVILTPNAPTIEINDIIPIPIDGPEDIKDIKKVYTDTLGSVPININITIDGIIYKLGNETDGSVNAIKTKTGYYISKRIIDSNNIPETPDNVINGVTYTVGGSISFNDENGKKQTFNMSKNKSDAGIKQNQIYWNIINGPDDIKPWFRSVDCGEHASFTPEEGGTFSSIPFTTYKSDDEKQYKGEWFFKVVNSWFAYSGFECLQAGNRPKTDFKKIYSEYNSDLESIQNN